MGLRRGEIFLAPPYYCQRAEFASERFFIFIVLLFFLFYIYVIVLAVLCCPLA